MRGLFGVADVELDVVSPLQRQEIFFRYGSFFGSCDCRWHKILRGSIALSACSKYKIDNHASQGGGSATTIMGGSSSPLRDGKKIMRLWRQKLTSPDGAADPPYLVASFGAGKATRFWKRGSFRS